MLRILRRRPWRILAAAAAAALLGAGSPAAARDQIRVVGSSTVFPFATAVAEQFGRTTSFRTPVIESTGSGGGIKLFCAGVGLEHPDVANSSRRIKRSEVGACESRGVSGIVEVKFGQDGIVLANSRGAKQLSFSQEDIFRALAKRVPLNGQLVDNPYEKWSEIDPALPDRDIEVLGPPPTSGTRDAFVEIAMEGGAREVPMLARLEEEDPDSFVRVAHSLREDGHYIQAGENDNLIVQKLQANPDAVGIFGFSFLDRNTDRIQGSTVNGKPPTFENISSGDYPVSRSLFFYVKKAHVGVVPGLQEFIVEFTSERAIGPDGYLADKGLVPLPREQRDRVRESARELSPLEL